MAGARPLHLSLGLILEEGLELTVLRRLLASVGQAASECGVQVVTGDTKVVERGKADGAFFTTSGIGLLEVEEPIDPGAIEAGDQLVVSGDLGRHGMAILAARHGLDLHPPLESDCAPLWPLVQRLLERRVRPHCLRDLTRGGLASALHELAAARGVEVRVLVDGIGATYTLSPSANATKPPSGEGMISSAAGNERCSFRGTTGLPAWMTPWWRRHFSSALKPRRRKPRPWRLG
jgi:hydrogenase expression/formation protein HypE